MTNLLDDTDGNLTFSQYDVSDSWVGGVDAAGFPTLSADVETLEGVPYSLTFSMAANLPAGAVDVAVEVIYAGEVIGTFLHSGALYAEQEINLTGTGGTDTLTFRIIENTEGDGGEVDTSGVIPSYSKDMVLMGQTVTVEAFAPGQSYLYQILEGQLVRFDLDTRTYTETEFGADFKINAIGFNTVDDVIYGLARQAGTDSQGNAIANGDVVLLDARGQTFKVGSTPYKHYIGDIDGEGQLWTFPGDLDYAVEIDVHTVDASGTPAMTVHDLTAISGAKGLADLAFHPETESFYGVYHSGTNGGAGTLVRVDISAVATGGAAEITQTPILGLIVGEEVRAGIPAMAYGASMVDADGNVYLGGNSGDHDLDTATATSGGFYRVVTDPATGGLYMELLAEAPRVSSNDGTMDVRGYDPFMGIDTSATVLLRAPELTIALAEDDFVALSAKGVSQTLDLLANDAVSQGSVPRLTQLDGQAVSAGDVLTLGNGEVVTYLGEGRIRVQGGASPESLTSEITYTIENENGVADTATIRIVTSPVDGTGDDDCIMRDYVDADGNAVDGPDGDDDLILGYAGNDKIFAYDGDDDIYGGVGNDFIRGYAGNDLIDGGDGNDVLDGGTGIDTMSGGAGDDIYYVDHVLDTVSEAGGSGRDKVMSSIDFTLDAAFEHLWLNKGSAAIAAIGNSADNIIVGNAQDNRLEGHDGRDNIIGRGADDAVYGGAGDDKLHGDAGADSLFGGGDNDKLHAGADDDLLDGGDGSDVLSGDGGNDTLIGGAGRDYLYGGDGDDRFLFAAGDGDDVIKNFSLAEDTIVFQGLAASGLTLRTYGNGMMIDYGPGDSIYLSNFGTQPLSGEDFVFDDI
ncbi:MAG: calcium-binding protein [Pseudomonadota bacterium]